MNTTNDSETSKPADLPQRKDEFDVLAENLEGESEVSKADDAFASLEREYRDVKNKRLEERFVWIGIIILLVDVFTFPSMQTWGAPIALLILQAGLLIVLGRILGVDDIRRLTERLLDTLSNRKG